MKKFKNGLKEYLKKGNLPTLKEVEEVISNY